MATSASHIATEAPNTANTRRGCVKLPSPSTKFDADRATRVCHRGGRRLVARQTHAFGPVRVPRSDRDEHDAERRPGREGDPRQQQRPSLSEEDGPEDDRGCEYDAVEKTLREQRPRGHECRDVRQLAHRLDPDQVTTPRRQDVVGAAPHGHGGEERAQRNAVTRAVQKDAPAQGHEDDVHEDETERSDDRQAGKLSDLAPRLPQVHLAEKEKQEGCGRSRSDHET